MSTAVSEDEAGAFSVKWHCKTGDAESSAPGSIFAGGLFIGRCQPIYSATEPILVWAEVSYRAYFYQSSSQPLQPVTLIVNEKPFTYHMDERLIDQAPVIQSFSVHALATAAGARCPLGELCELNDGDVIFNGQLLGDYDRHLTMRVTASDLEGDPLTVEWFCQSGPFFAPITNQTPTQANCDPLFIAGPIQVYVKVSDGSNVVWSQPRLLYMAELIH